MAELESRWPEISLTAVTPTKETLGMCSDRLSTSVFVYAHNSRSQKNLPSVKIEPKFVLNKAPKMLNGFSVQLAKCDEKRYSQNSGNQFQNWPDKATIVFQSRGSEWGTLRITKNEIKNVLETMKEHHRKKKYEYWSNENRKSNQTIDWLMFLSCFHIVANLFTEKKPGQVHLLIVRLHCSPTRSVHKLCAAPSGRQVSVRSSLEQNWKTLAHFFKIGYTSNFQILNKSAFVCRLQIA